MEIKQLNSQNQGRFIALDGDVEAGEIVYTWLNSHLISIDHTRVDDAYRGQGIASQILNKVVEFAKENNIKIQPVCSFAVHAFAKNEKKWSDLKA